MRKVKNKPTVITYPHDFLSTSVEEVVETLFATCLGSSTYDNIQKNKQQLLLISDHFIHGQMHNSQLSSTALFRTKHVIHQ
jgi:hypothetical protein